MPTGEKRSMFFKAIGTIARRFFLGLGIMTALFTVLIAIVLFKGVDRTSRPLPGQFTLTYTFQAGLNEDAQKPSLNDPLLKTPVTLHDITAALYRAAQDPRVDRFVARIEGIDYGQARVQELRAAIKTFRAAGKHAIVFADDYGGFGSGTADYYLASAFDDIWLQPVGALSLTGLASQSPYVRDLLDRIGAKPVFLRRGKYKSGAENLTHTHMSPENREMLQSLITNLHDQIAADIAQSRQQDLDHIQNLMRQGPFTAEQALENTLIDRIGYFDEIEKDINQTVTLTRYAAQGRSQKAAPGGAVALVQISGAIVPHAQRSSGLHVSFGGDQARADKIAAAIKSATEDKNIAALVVRIDSPGGSPSASETLHRALVQAAAAQKPVIISMGDYAASGGYWIATAGDKIFAQSATLTGSIGVFGGKFVLQDLWRKLGVRWESVASSDNATLWSSAQDFTPAQREKVQHLLDQVYDRFLDRVAQGRSMPVEHVETLAQGRVYTGDQAKDIGLVDAIGGLEEAIAYARESANLDQNARVILFPPKKSTLEVFIDMLTGEGFTVEGVKISLPGFAPVAIGF